jgi:glucoamylase
MGPTGHISRNKGFAQVLAEYEKGWADFVKTLPKVDAKYQAQFNMAAMVIKALEDKTARGGNVASLSVPWGGGGNGNTGGTGYRMVWSRDLYHVFTAFLAIGDKPAAERALDFLFKVQQQPDGSFPQNSGLNGKDGWGSLQMDEVAYPLVMAWQLGRFDKDTWGHVKRSADFIVAKGPFSPQERWEERPGYSPSTIAAQIAGLVCAAEIAKRNGDTLSSEEYLRTADAWAANVEKWTATTKGKYGDGNYYLRISEKGEPDGNHKIELNNNAGTFYEHEIVDAGFLELVRFGIKRADDPLIVNSLKVVDQLLKVDTPSGPAFYRYTHDGYGEMDDGRRWNWDRKYTGKGRPWPLLSGERGQYEIALGNLSGHGAGNTSADLFRSYARLDQMLAFASPSLMIAEQIWDKAAISNTDRRFVPELKPGKGTGSATPLAWSMAAFIRLATNLKAGKNLDTPQIVYDRYVLGKK